MPQSREMPPALFYLLAGLLFLTALWGCLDLGAYYGGLAENDALYLHAFLRDLLSGFRAVRGWVLQPAPSFFPDMIFYLPWVWLGFDIVPSFVGYALATGLALGGVLYSLSDFFLGDKKTRLLFSLAALVLLQAASRFNWWFAPVFLPACHTGIQILGLGLLALRLGAIQGRVPASPLVWAGLAFLGVLSDLAILPLFLLPALAADLWAWSRGRLRTGLLFKINFWTLLGAALGLGALELLWRPGNALWRVGRILLLTGKIPLWELFSTALATLLHGAKEIPFAPWLLGAWLLVSARLLRPPFKPAQKNGPGVPGAFAYLAVFSLAAVAGNFATAVFTGLNGGTRYYMALMVMPWLGLCLRLAALKSRAIPGVLVLALAAALAAGAVFSPKISLARPYPEEARWVDKNAAEWGARAGYVSFGAARRLEMLSRLGLKLAQLVPDPGTNLVLAPYRWVSNPAAAGGSAEGKFPCYSIFLAPEADEVKVASVFGPPRKTSRWNGKVMMLYDRPGDRAFRGFLRKSLAFNDHLPVLVKPVWPAALARYPFDEWIPESARAHFQIKQGHRQEARFGWLRHENLLEVLLDGNHGHEVIFYMRRIPSGRVLLKPDKARPGLAARYIPVPLAAQRMGYDRVAVRPLGKRNFCDMGYVFAYNDVE